MTEKKYLVRRAGREITVPANNSTEAKRKACQFWGIPANNRLIGILACSAKLVKEGKL